MADTDEPRPSFWNASTLNLAAMVVGMAVGWFLGPKAAVLKPLAGAFINLLTMLSVPFLVLALVHGLGCLPASRLAALGRVGAVSLGAIWTFSIATSWVVAALFPREGNAAFYSDPSVTGPEQPGLLSLLIPSNPFHALANGVAPAVAFFCLMFAWQLARVEGKERLLGWLDVSLEVLKGMAGLVNRMLPLATFILSIAVFGGLNAAVVSQVRVFVLAVMVMTVVLGFGILPLAVAAVTPIGFRRVLRTSVPAVLSAFLTGSPFAVLPQIIGAAQALLDDEAPADDEAPPDDAAIEAERHEHEAEASTIIPVAINFPTAGSMLTLLFVMFAASAFDRPLTAMGHLKLALVGTGALFSGNTAAIGFLCALTEIPPDAAVIFMGISGVTDRFRGVLSTMSLIALTAFTHYGVQGRVRLSPVRLGLVAVGCLLPLYLCCRVVAGYLVMPPAIQDYYRTRSVELPAAQIVRKDRDVTPQTSARSAMARVREGRSLRVGLQVERPPFSYRNDAGQLSGYSVALANLLAADLEGRLEIVEVEPGSLVRDIDEGRVDLVLSPVQVVPERLITLAFASRFGVVKPVVVFRDERRAELERRAEQSDWAGFTVGVRQGSYLSQQAAGLLPGARVELVESPDALVKRSDLDGFLWNDLEATAWEVTNPTFEQQLLPQAPPVLLAYPQRAGDAELARFTETWFDMQKSRGALDRLYKEWILGRGAKEQGAPVDRLLEWMVGD